MRQREQHKISMPWEWTNKYEGVGNAACDPRVSMIVIQCSSNRAWRPARSATESAGESMNEKQEGIQIKTVGQVYDKHASSRFIRNVPTVLPLLFRFVERVVLQFRVRWGWFFSSKLTFSKERKIFFFFHNQQIEVEVCSGSVPGKGSLAGSCEASPPCEHTWDKERSGQGCVRQTKKEKQGFLQGIASPLSQTKGKVKWLQRCCKFQVVWDFYFNFWSFDVFATERLNWRPFLLLASQLALEFFQPSSCLFDLLLDSLFFVVQFCECNIRISNEQACDNGNKVSHMMKRKGHLKRLVNGDKKKSVSTPMGWWEQENR